MRYLVVLLLAATATTAFAQNRKPQVKPETTRRELPNGRFAIAVSADGGTAWMVDTQTGMLFYCLTALGPSLPTPGAPSRQESCTQVIGGK